VPNNSSYAMRVSEVLQVQFSQASFVSVDTDVATKSRTAHSCDRYVSAGVKKKIGVRRLFGFKNQGTKGSVGLVPEKNASRGKWEFLGGVHLLGTEEKNS